MRGAVSALVVLPLAAALWFGCATSGVADFVDDAGGIPDDDGGVAPQVLDAGKDHTSNFDADPGGGFDAAPVDATPDPGDGGGGSCVAPNTCLAAADVGKISGDTSKYPTVTATDFTSKWMLINVSEDDNNPLGKNLNFHASLTSPPGANFDLFLYVNAGGSPTDRACTAVSASSTNATGDDTASLNWGEGTPANGSDDSRIVSVEVRWISGTCAPGSKWTLTLTGN